MKKILILAGGYSNEKEISLQTAKSVYKELSKDKKKKLKVINPNGDLIKKIKKFKPDLVLNLLHGRYGEDGYIQSILENQKVKYTHSGVLSSSIAIDKEISKKIFKENNIKLIRADWTKPDRNIDAFLKQFNKFGIPFNAFFSQKYPDGIIMSEILTEKEIRLSIEKLI